MSTPAGAGTTFPPPLPDIAHIECAAGSRRDPAENLGQPCHVCEHWACRLGPTGPVPCESCQLVVYVRRIGGNVTAGAVDVVGQLGAQVTELTRRVGDLQGRIDRANSFPI